MDGRRKSGPIQEIQQTDQRLKIQTIDTRLFIASRRSVEENLHKAEHHLRQGRRKRGITLCSYLFVSSSSTAFMACFVVFVNLFFFRC